MAIRITADPEGPPRLAKRVADLEAVGASGTNWEFLKRHIEALSTKKMSVETLLAAHFEVPLESSIRDLRAALRADL